MADDEESLFFLAFGAERSLARRGGLGMTPGNAFFPKLLRRCGFFRVIGDKIVFQRGDWGKLSFLRLFGLPLPDAKLTG